MPDPADLAAEAGLLELTAAALLPEHIGRVVQIPMPPTTGVLLELEQGVDSPAIGGVVMRGATRIALDLVGSSSRGHGHPHPDPLPAYLQPTVRVVVDLRLEIGVCARCAQVLLRTSSDCWHPHDVQRACPPEPPLDQWPSGFMPGRPGRDQWRPRPTSTEEPST